MRVGHFSTRSVIHGYSIPNFAVIPGKQGATNICPNLFMEMIKAKLVSFSTLRPPCMPTHDPILQEILIPLIHHVTSGPVISN
jgi:hypothetical protein